MGLTVFNDVCSELMQKKKKKRNSLKFCQLNALSKKTHVNLYNKKLTKIEGIKSKKTIILGNLHNLLLKSTVIIIFSLDLMQYVK